MLAFLVGCGNDASKPAETGKPSTSEKITVQAAASLKGALTELTDAYKKSHNLADDQIATVKRIVLGNPETVPAGNYGKQVLTKLGVWEQVEPNVVYAKDVKAVTASISQGAGDAGFIYKTDAIAAGDAVQISAVTPADSHDPVIYPIGIIKKYDNALAKDFYQYVMSPEGQKVLEKYGFSTSK